MNDLEKRIFSIINKPGLACLATITEDGKPWARYVIAVGFEDMTIRLATFLASKKVKHIAKNPNVHLVCGVPNAEYQDSYLQIQGSAIVTTDKLEKQSFWNNQLKNIFTGPDDPNYAIVIIKPKRIELWSGMSEPEVWQKKEE